MRRALATLALLLAFPAPAAALDADQLGSSLARELSRAGASSGGYARDLDTGHVFVSVRPDVPRIPASVEKLFVSVANLETRGAADAIQTRVVSSAPLDPLTGTIAGDLLLVGGGDPTLSETGLEALADDVAAAGVRRVEGSVRGDESLFDRLRGGPRTGGRPDYDMTGRLGALVIGRGYQQSPALHAAKKLVVLLRARGVRVLGRTGTGAAPDDATELATVSSSPLALLLRSMNVPSDNFIAEMLLKRLGAVEGSTGTTAEGARVARAALARLDVRPTLVDGSGLSRSNRTTPRQVVELFRQIRDKPYGATLRATLAVTGRTGTVSRRMRRSAARGRCQVKTGTLNGISNLVGVCRARGGNEIAFAWLMGRVNVWTAQRIQDRLTSAVARYDG
jgi:D-alanyl-D-alanine carboxypeptidase/D-alanyl-D-alanine-endopeptidase (penicillin-binding protein 4)